MTDAAITFQNVTKKFRSDWGKAKFALNGVSLTIAQGSVVGLLGPNGSGKSTLLKLIVGLLRPSAGEIYLQGLEVRSPAARRQLGYVPENPRFPRFIPAFDLLRFYGKLQGLTGSSLNREADRALQAVGLSSVATERVGGFSKGMTQRLALAQALMDEPKVLILDEPLSGLDPRGRVEMRRLISEIHERSPQTSIFLSSHLVEDVETLCSSVALLNGGRLVRFARTEVFMNGPSFEAAVGEEVTS